MRIARVWCICLVTACAGSDSGALSSGAAVGGMGAPNAVAGVGAQTAGASSEAGKAAPMPTGQGTAGSAAVAGVGASSSGRGAAAAGRSAAGGAGASGGGDVGTAGVRAQAGSGSGAGTAAAGRGASAGSGSGMTTNLGMGAQCSMPTGSVSYTLAKAAQPTAAQQAAYDKITAAMDAAISYYNCYTNITKRDMVSYNPDVATADGSTNGSIRFGSPDSINYITAMHEIAHSVGVGGVQFGPLVVDGIFTGKNATAQLVEITGKPDDKLHADKQHFWPYGLNYTSEVKSSADLINHCKMVVAIRKDLGM